MVTRHRSSRPPKLVADEIGARVFVEQLDGTDEAACREIGARHPITGIVLERAVTDHVAWLTASGPD